MLCCIISSYIYMHFAAFGNGCIGIEPSEECNASGGIGNIFDYIFLVIFGVDIIIQFLLDFKPEDSYTRVRDLVEIAKRYFKTNFLFDFLPMMPFHLFGGKQAKLGYLVKVIRISKGTRFLSSNQFMRFIKDVFKRRLEQLVKTDKEKAEDQETGNNHIDSILIIGYSFRTVRLVLVIFTVSYYIGMAWYIFCELTLLTPEKSIETKQNQGFIHEFNIEDYTVYEKSVLMIYYAFTTLSTVGFGDFHPRSNVERLLCAFILLTGVAIFSYIMGNFIDILQGITQLNADFDEGDKERQDDLSKWFGLLKRFNSSRSISIDLKMRIEEYFDYMWMNDKNQALRDPRYINLLIQLPSDVSRKIYSDFLFKTFRNKFKKFFDFPKDL